MPHVFRVCGSAFMYRLYSILYIQLYSIYSIYSYTAIQYSCFRSHLSDALPSILSSVISVSLVLGVCTHAAQILELVVLHTIDSFTTVRLQTMYWSFSSSGDRVAGLGRGGEWAFYSGRGGFYSRKRFPLCERGHLPPIFCPAPWPHASPFLYSAKYLRKAYNGPLTMGNGPFRGFRFI